MECLVRNFLSYYKVVFFEYVLMHIYTYKLEKYIPVQDSVNSIISGDVWQEPLIYFTSGF